MLYQMFTISSQLTLRNLVNRESFVNFLHFQIFYRKAMERLFNISDHKKSNFRFFCKYLFWSILRS